MRDLLGLFLHNVKRRLVEWREDPPVCPGLCGETFVRRVQERWDVPGPATYRRLYD
jgi:hypothetical protein